MPKNIPEYMLPDSVRNEKKTEVLYDLLAELERDETADDKWKTLSTEKTNTLRSGLSARYNHYMLSKILDFYSPVKVSYINRYDKNDLGQLQFRVAYTESDGTRKETIFNQIGDFISGDKPTFKKAPREYVNQNSLLAIYQRMEKDPTNILLKTNQIDELQKRFKNKPLGEFLLGGHPRVWLMSGVTPPHYRVVKKNYHDINNAWDMTFSTNGDVISGNYPHSLGDDDKHSEFKDGVKRILDKKEYKSAPHITKER